MLSGRKYWLQTFLTIFAENCRRPVVLPSLSWMRQSFLSLWGMRLIFIGFEYLLCVYAHYLPDLRRCLLMWHMLESLSYADCWISDCSGTCSGTSISCILHLSNLFWKLHFKDFFLAGKVWYLFGQPLPVESDPCQGQRYFKARV